MATKQTKKSALNLYKQLLRASTQFVTYNYRAYGWRHTKYTFRLFGICHVEGLPKPLSTDSVCDI